MRLPDWEKRLCEFTSANMNAAGQTGISDCIIVALDAAQAVTGKDYAIDLRGKYKTQAEADRLMMRKGFKSLEEVLSSEFKKTNRLAAKRGDIGIVEIDGIETCGFFCEYGFAAKTENGLMFVNTTEVKIAFEVN